MKADKASGKPTSKKPAKGSQLPQTSKSTDKVSSKSLSKKSAKKPQDSPISKTANGVSGKSPSKKLAKSSTVSPTSNTAGEISNQGLRPKLLKRFYEALVLLRVLGQVQGEKLGAESLEENDIHSLGSKELRRKVMYHLCVVCDFERGGDSVTAIASEHRPSGPLYWMAANKHVEKIEIFLIDVLEMLERQASLGSRTNHVVAFERRLFEKFVLFQRTRIKEYWKPLEKQVKAELGRASRALQERYDSNEYVQWLQEFQRPLLDAEHYFDLSQYAYDTRHSNFLRIDHDPLIGETTKMENDSRVDIRHYVGRLGASRRAARFLANAVVRSPDLFLGASVESTVCEISVDNSEKPSMRARLNLDGICGRMFSESPGELQKFQTALKALDRTGTIMPRVRAQYQDKNWKPRVHAELILLEKLYQQGCTFYEDDKFIACSKAACFCCYHYICAHPGSFARPSCHNKVWLNWCPPNLLDTSIRWQNQQLIIMNELIKQVRRAAIQRVFNAERGSRWHPDSSTGITPSIAHVPESDLEKITLASGSVCDSPRSHSSRSFQESDCSEDFDDDYDGGVSLGVNE